MFKRLIFTAFTCFTFQALAFAQTSTSEDQLVKSLEAEKITELKVRQLVSEVQIHQAGGSNQAHVTQRQISSTPNAAFIEQVGVLNYANIRQTGQSNNVNAAQLGNLNSYESDIVGTGNASNVLQRGNANNINQSIYGNNLDYTLIQLGNGNTINQIETSAASKPYKIVQEGNNMNITIEQSSWGVPKGKSSN